MVKPNAKTRFIFQLINKTSGNRSPAVINTASEYASNLKSVSASDESPLKLDDNYVLVLAQLDDATSEITEDGFSRFPLVIASTFVSVVEESLHE